MTGVTVRNNQVGRPPSELGKCLVQRDGWQGRGIWVPNTGVSLQVTIAVFPAFSLGL